MRKSIVALIFVGIYAAIQAAVLWALAPLSAFGVTVSATNVHTAVIGFLILLFCVEAKAIVEILKAGAETEDAVNQIDRRTRGRR